MDSWFIYSIVAIVSGLMGWFLRQYFMQKDLAAVNATVSSASNTITRLSADLASLKKEKNDVINQLNHDLELAKEGLTIEKREVARLKIISEYQEELPEYEPLNLISSAVVDNDHLNKEHWVLQLGVMKDENSYLKDELIRLRESEVEPQKLALKSCQKKYKKRDKKYKSLRDQYNQLVIDYNDLDEQIKSLKKDSKTQTVVKEVPVEIIKEVEVRESIDYAKLKRLLMNELPTIRSRKLISSSKKKGKPGTKKS